MNDTGKRILQAMQEAKLSYGELSKMTAIPKSALQRYAIGETEKIPIDRIETIANATGVSAAYLIGWADDDPLQDTSEDVSSIEEDKREAISRKYGGFIPKMVLKPLIGIIPCGNPIEAIQQSDEFVEVPATIHCDFALKCKGDSMIGARIHDGDIVYIRIQPDVENGEIAAVMNSDDEATLKRIRKGRNSITLWPENPNYEPTVYTGENLANLHIIGKAVGFTSLL